MSADGVYGSLFGVISPLHTHSIFENTHKRRKQFANAKSADIGNLLFSPKAWLIANIIRIITCAQLMPLHTTKHILKKFKHVLIEIM